MTLDHATLMLVADLEHFRGRWTSLARELPPARVSELGERATVESVGSSTRMDGARLTDGQVRSFLFGADPRPPATRDEQAVAGYADALEMVYDAVGGTALDTDFIRQLHGVVTWYSGTAGSRRGEYRRHAQHVPVFDAGGRPAGTLFAGVTPERIPGMMEELVRWTGSALESGEYHPLLVIAAFVAQLHVIHPFADGSGRLSRLLCTWMLVRAGYTYLPIVSLERVLEESRVRCYRALGMVGDLFEGGPGGIGEWTRFFLLTLRAHRDELKRLIDKERRVETLPELSSELVTLVRESGRLTMSEAIARTGANRNTIKVHLRRLVQAGRLVRRGAGRGTWYTLA